MVAKRVRATPGKLGEGFFGGVAFARGNKMAANAWSICLGSCRRGEVAWENDGGVKRWT
jgi:hypothetical protein